jgi:DNA-binding NarL/FixJ family response regulator
MTPIRVLIADDQRLFAGSLKVVLESHGRGELSVVGIAYDGREAVEMADGKKPDVILMDVRMPVVDGVEATRKIRHKHPDVKIMILTTFDDDEYAMQALGNGATGYVLKSIQPDELVTAVKAVHGGSFLISSSVGVRLIRTTNSGSQDPHNNMADEIQTFAREFPELTRREAELLSLVARNLDNHEIAERLFIAGQTVKNYLSRVYQKLGVADRLHAIRIATERLEKYKGS